ncbi:MAG: uracil-DNA glycosylase [Candidatus Omnitrophota bacterium]
MDKNMKKELRGIVGSVRSYIELETMAGTGECLGAPGSGKAAKPRAWEAFEKEVTRCKNCSLHTTRKNVVVGAGSRKAALMFIGEAPGRDEDIQGKPFVGRAGNLLTRIIEAMGLSRDEVYIGNVLKCRPPNNRPPLPDEVIACRENIKRQIELIQPRILCTLGKFASQTLLSTTTPISKLRGRFFEYNGIKLMPTYHPAYLLRNPGEKRHVWQDMKKIMKELE